MNIVDTIYLGCLYTLSICKQLLQICNIQAMLKMQSTVTGQSFAHQAGAWATQEWTSWLLNSRLKLADLLLKLFPLTIGLATADTPTPVIHKTVWYSQLRYMIFGMMFLAPDNNLFLHSAKPLSQACFVHTHLCDMLCKTWGTEGLLCIIRPGSQACRTCTEFRLVMLRQVFQRQPEHCQCDFAVTAVSCVHF